LTAAVFAFFAWASNDRPAKLEAEDWPRNCSRECLFAAKFSPRKG
jgi:hypothetical protein